MFHLWNPNLLQVDWRSCLTFSLLYCCSVLYMHRALLLCVCGFFFPSFWLRLIMSPQQRGDLPFLSLHQSPLLFPPLMFCPSFSLVKLYLTRLTVFLLFFSLSSAHLSSAHMKAHMKSFCGVLTCVSVLGTNTCLSEMLARCLLSLFLCLFGLFF